MRAKYSDQTAGWSLRVTEISWSSAMGGIFHQEMDTFARLHGMDRFTPQARSVVLWSIHWILII